LLGFDFFSKYKRKIKFKREIEIEKMKDFIHKTKEKVFH